MDQRLTNLASIHEDSNSIPGLAQWFKDLVLPWAVVQVTDAVQISCCCGYGIGQQLQLRLDSQPGNLYMLQMWPQKDKKKKRHISISAMLKCGKYMHLGIHELYIYIYICVCIYIYMYIQYCKNIIQAAQTPSLNGGWRGNGGFKNRAREKHYIRKPKLREAGLLLGLKLFHSITNL